MIKKILPPSAKDVLRQYKKRFFNRSKTINEPSSQHTMATFFPARGGMLASWIVEGQEIFYLNRDSLKDFSKSVRSGMPILFPICGNLPDGFYSLHGKSYRLGYHGFARDWPWKVYDDSCQGQGKITFSLNSNRETLASYPFNFQLLFTYYIKGSTLTIEQKIINYSPESMPFSIGMHPYFFTPDKSQLTLDIPAKRYHNRLDGRGYEWQGNLDFTQDEHNLFFQELSQPEFHIIDHQRQFKLTVSFKPPYSSLLLWCLRDNNFCCIEPWSADFNAFNTGQGLTYVKPCSSLTTALSLSVAKL